MFVKVTVCLRPNSLTEFTNLMECEIPPRPRKQEGFAPEPHRVIHLEFAADDLPDGLESYERV